MLITGIIIFIAGVALGVALTSRVLRHEHSGESNGVNVPVNRGSGQTDQAIAYTATALDHSTIDHALVWKKDKGAKGIGFPSTGTFIVGREIKPGLYRNVRGVSYWARLSGTQDSMDEIIANDTPEESGVSYVEIFASDVAFETMGGDSRWVMVNERDEGERATTFGDGMYIVGKDIQPGRYRNSGSPDNDGYWARLSDFSGTTEAIIENEYGAEGPVVIDIKPSDVGFKTQDNGIWTRIDASSEE